APVSGRRPATAYPFSAGAEIGRWWPPRTSAMACSSRRSRRRLSPRWCSTKRLPSIWPPSGPIGRVGPPPRQDTPVADYKRTAKIEWFMGGKLNASYNCLDRHLSTPRRNKAALIWEGDSPDESRTLTYNDVYRETCKFANALKKVGVKKGDRVTIYLPMVPEL